MDALDAFERDHLRGSTTADGKFLEMLAHIENARRVCLEQGEDKLSDCYTIVTHL